MATALVILAAGKGTRMKSDLPKVLHEVGSAPLLRHAIDAGSAVEPSQVVVVTGHGGDRVREALAAFAPSAKTVEQTEQLGTAHAVLQSEAALEGFAGDVFVLYGDTPFITPETLHRMRAARADGAAVVVLGFEAEEPGRYGRLILDETGALDRIVEAKEATPEELAVTLCNSGVVCADRDELFSILHEVGNDNAKGEYYLTDIVEIARGRGLTCAAVSCPESETMGCDTRIDLARAEGIFQARKRAEALENGVTLRDPDSTYFSFDTQLSTDVTVEPHVVFLGGVKVASGATVRAFSHLEDTTIGERASVGPHVRMRGNSVIGARSKIGNFVETKKVVLAEGVKAGHLSYLGDAEIGTGTNIGAGTITCNYDGKGKHQTHIGAGVFVGSNTALVAPVTLGDGAVTGAGSTITDDVGADELAIARGKQSNKTGAARIMAKVRELSARKKRG
ncbi:MAG: bifunctional UDP-N-acetylglucosamine diphosphorylase/glucosamine-1-phosphate N-acetyltransferase GlmU [Pseudomonadota bacterium]